MLVRVAAAVLVGLFVAGCESTVADAPPAVVQTATAVVPAQNVPANRWRAVLVAGDSSSPAFDNGIESLRERLTAAGVRDIKLLSADPGRVAGGQLASSANVRHAVGSGGGEACLAFVTSHGEERGFFLRVDRRLFGPALLDQALTAGCGGVPTVVVVSACHSGTFIDNQMRKPNRIILTAAATDRTSFGCGSDDEFTYYDRCLLQQFDDATTWRGLAAATTACVETMERRLGVRPPSKPQTFVGAAVADLRLPGR